MAAKMSPIITPEIEARFWANVDKSEGQGPNGDCWCWTGKMMALQYGAKLSYPTSFRAGGQSNRTSHIAMAIDGRARPSAEMEGLHSCDYPPCVRPSHLRWGTQEENRKEWLERRKPGPKIVAPEVVRAIRASTDRNYILAERYGMTQANVCTIKARRSHKHIE